MILLININYNNRVIDSSDPAIIVNFSFYERDEWLKPINLFLNLLLLKRRLIFPFKNIV